MTWSWLVTIALIASAFAAVWWRMQTTAGQMRHRLEDALKHMFDQEYRGRHASLASLSGALRSDIACGWPLHHCRQMRDATEIESTKIVSYWSSTEASPKAAQTRS